MRFYEILLARRLSGGGGGGGSDAAFKALVEGSLTEITAEMAKGITELRPYAFYNDAALESVSFPDVTTIGTDAFKGASGLKNVEFDRLEVVPKLFSGYTNIESVTFRNATTIVEAAFAGCVSLEKVSFPHVTRLKGYNSGNYTAPGIFQGTKLSRLSADQFPALTTIEACALNRCDSLVSVSLPLVVTIGYRAFDNCANLEEIYFPSITRLVGTASGNWSPPGAFAYCTKLTHFTQAQFPSLVNIDNRAFKDCTNIISAEFNLVTVLGSGAFIGCTNLTSASFPSLVSIGTEAFLNCTSLPSIDLHDVASIPANVFNGCAALGTVVLRGGTLCPLGNVNAFAGTPFRDGTGGRVYVPAALLADYQAATNWSALESATFLPIEGSEYEENE